MKLRSLLVLLCALLCAPAFAQVNPGTSPLTGPKGGTNNAFMQFAGPAASLKTFTIPNANSTLAALGSLQTWTAVQTFSDGTVRLLGTSSASVVVAPASPPSNVVSFWFDSTALRFHDISSTGVVGTTVVADAGAANNFLTGINSFGGITKAQPSASNLSGIGTGVATALGGNVGTAGAFVVNGGVLGTPSSGTATNLTGTASGLTAGNATLAATVTTNANLTGPVTSVGNATSIGTNQVARSNEAQGLARSVIGNGTNAAANVGDIQGTANQALVVNSAGTALAFGQVNLASSAAVTGTLPIANGGTGDTGTAWTPYTPTMTCSGGAGTWSAAGRSKTIGKTVYVSVALTLTAIGTCNASAVSVTFSLPATAQSPLTMVIRETGLTGVAYQGYAAATATVGTLAGMAGGNVALASGDIFIGSGVYESQ